MDISTIWILGGTAFVPIADGKSCYLLGQLESA